MVRILRNRAVGSDSTGARSSIIRGDWNNMNDVDEQVEREFDESSLITNEEYNSAAEWEDKDHGTQDRSNRSGRFDVWSTSSLPSLKSVTPTASSRKELTRWKTTAIVLATLLGFGVAFGLQGFILRGIGTDLPMFP